MSATIRSLLIKWGVDLTGAQKGFKQLSKELNTIGKGLKSAGSTLTKSVTLPVVALGAASVKLASDMEETTNKINEVFEDNAGKIEAWSKDSIKNMGLAQQTAMDTAALFGDMGKGMKLPTEEGVKMSMSLTQLSADMASFKNISQERVQQALTGVYTGETEALKSLGIVMTEANLKQYAMEKGITKNIQSMTQAEKVQLRYAYVMDVTADAQGDFIRTGGGAANQTRMLKEQLKQAGADIGKILLPTITDLLKTVNGLLQEFQELNPETKKTIVTIALISAAVGPVLSVLGHLTSGVGNLVKGLSSAVKAISGGAGFLGALSALIGPAGTVVVAIAAVAAVVGGLIIAFSGAESETDKLRKKYEELNKEIEESRKQFETQVAETETNAGAAQKLADELYTLADKEKKTNAEKKRMVSLVEQLNSVYPDLNLEINEQTGLLNKQYKTVKDIIEAKKQEMVYSIYAEQYKELLEQEIKLAEELETAEENLAAAKERYNKASKEFNDLSWTNMSSSQAFASSLFNASNELKNAQTNVDSFTNALNANKAEQDALVAKMDETANGIYSFGEAVTTTNEDITLSNEVMAAQQEEIQRRIETSTQAHYDAMGGIYDKGIEQNKTKLDQVNKNLRTQVEQFESWRSNIKKVAELVPKDVYEQLVKLGPESAPLIAELVSPKNKDKLNEFVTIMQTKSKAAKDAALEDEGLGGLANEVSGVMDDMKGEIEKTDEIKTAAYNLGKSITSGLEKGMDSGTSVLYSRARAIARQVINVMRSEIKPGSPSKVTTLFGQSISDGLTAGMAKNAMAAFKQSRKIASGIVDSFKTISMPNYTINATGKSTTPTTGDMYSAFSRALKENAKSGGLYIENFYNSTDDDIRELAYKLERCRQQASAAIGG